MAKSGHDSDQILGRLYPMWVSGLRDIAINSQYVRHRRDCVWCLAFLRPGLTLVTLVLLLPTWRLVAVSSRALAAGAMTFLCPGAILAWHLRDHRRDPTAQGNRQ